MALPLSYNIRNVKVRWQVTLLAISGISLVVAVTWTTLSSLTGSQAPVNALGGRATFEFQIRRRCADEATSNWSNSVTWLHASCCTAVTIPVVADRYGNEITWSIVSGGTTYASGGPYMQNASNGQYPQTTGTDCLPDGCYELRINDSYGDGICCAFGNGSIQVLGAGGAVLAVSHTTAFSQVSVPFCIGSGVQVMCPCLLGWRVYGHTDERCLARGRAHSHARTIQRLLVGRKWMVAVRPSAPVC